MSVKEERAVELFYKGYNCAQAVFCAFAPDFGMDEETARAVSSSFGGGMGRLRQVCGTLSGAFMVLGLAFGRYPPGDNAGKNELYGTVRALAADFEKETGSIVCGELLKKGGLDASPGGVSLPRTDEFYKKRRVCVESVRLSARLTEKYLNAERRTAPASNEAQNGEDKP